MMYICMFTVCGDTERPASLQQGVREGGATVRLETESWDQVTRVL